MSEINFLTEKNIEDLKKFVSWETRDNNKRPTEEDINDCIINIFKEFGFNLNPSDSLFKKMKDVVLIPLFKICFCQGYNEGYDGGYKVGYEECLLNRTDM